MRRERPCVRQMRFALCRALSEHLHTPPKKLLLADALDLFDDFGGRAGDVAEA
jgi:hypothetical protein